jgi:hypothetical protein
VSEVHFYKPDWVLKLAADKAGWEGFDLPTLRLEYGASDGETFRALCDMIERYEQPPVDRKLLCAREAAKEYGYDQGDLAENACIRAIELWEEGFGK